MVPRLDLLMMVMVLLSPWMEPILFHGGGRLPQSMTPSLEQLLLNSRFPVIIFTAAVSLLVVNSWLLVLDALYMSGTSPAQSLTSSRPLLVTLVTSMPSYFPPPLSQYLMTDQLSFGRLTHHLQTQLELVQCPFHPLWLQLSLSVCNQNMALLSQVIQRGQ